eukprot:5127226-Amphidinium_carterae.1
MENRTNKRDVKRHPIWSRSCLTPFPTLHEDLGVSDPVIFGSGLRFGVPLNFSGIQNPSDAEQRVQNKCVTALKPSIGARPNRAP